MGPWQFIYLTGKRYGLKVNWWVDERRDPEKSTIAAAKYLKDLYDMFECWYLAAAGYNAGEAKIARAMKRYQTEDFWELAKYPYLKKETRDYVPQMIAAALIAKDPEQYGFTSIEYQEPLRYEKVRVPGVDRPGVIAKACEIPLEELKELNPELLRNCTPPDVPDYEIKIPFGKKELFLQNFEALQPVRKVQFKTHVVKTGGDACTNCQALSSRSGSHAPDQPDEEDDSPFKRDEPADPHPRYPKRANRRPSRKKPGDEQDPDSESPRRSPMSSRRGTPCGALPMRWE